MTWNRLTRRSLLRGMASGAAMAALPVARALSAAVRNRSGSPVTLPGVFSSAVLAPGETRDFTYPRIPEADLRALVELARGGAIDFPGDGAIDAGLPTGNLTYVLNGQEPAGQSLGGTVYSIDDAARRTLKEYLPPVAGTSDPVPVWVSGKDDWFGSTGPIPGRWLGKNFLRGNQVICLGGVEDSGQASVDFYDLSTGASWRSSQVAMLDGAPRLSLIGAWVGRINEDQFVLFGGEQSFQPQNGGPPNADRSSHVYDARTDKWTRAGDVPLAACIFCNYQDEKAITLEDGRILVPGGITIEASIDNFERFGDGSPGVITEKGTLNSIVFTPGPIDHPELGTWDYTRTGAASPLTAAIGPADTTIQVGDTSAFPAAGAFTLGTEIVEYSAKTAGSFSGCTRGASFSTAVAHAAGVPARQMSQAFGGADHFQLCRLADGRVLMIIGARNVHVNDPVMSQFGYGALIVDSPIHAQLFDPKTNTWSKVPNMPRIPGEDDRFPPGVSNGCRQQPNLCATGDGRAIVAGGYMGRYDELPDASTTLAAAVDDQATSIPVSSTDGFLDQGRFAIDGEWIDYASKTATSFDGCRRGAGLPWFGPASHAAGAAVLRIRSYDSLTEDPDAPGALQDNNFRKSCLIFDPALFDAGRDPWVRIADLNFPRSGTTLVPIDDRRFYIASNGGNPVAFGNPWGGWPRNEIYDLATNTWTLTAAMDQAAFDLGFQMADFIYFGGQYDPILVPGKRIVTLSAGGNVSDGNNTLGCIYSLGQPSTETKLPRQGKGAPDSLKGQGSSAPPGRGQPSWRKRSSASIRTPTR